MEGSGLPDERPCGLVVLGIVVLVLVRWLAP